MTRADLPLLLYVSAWSLIWGSVVLVLAINATRPDDAKETETHE